MYVHYYLLPHRNLTAKGRWSECVALRSTHTASTYFTNFELIKIWSKLESGHLRCTSWYDHRSCCCRNVQTLVKSNLVVSSCNTLLLGTLDDASNTSPSKSFKSPINMTCRSFPCCLTNSTSTRAWASLLEHDLGWFGRAFKCAPTTNTSPMVSMLRTPNQCFDTPLDLILGLLYWQRE